MDNFFVLVAFACLLIVPPIQSKTTTIQLVHVFFRHGSRTPEVEDAIPSDPYKEETFMPTGWGQLTNTGKQRAHKLGELLRQRYDSLLGQLYTPNSVQTFTTDFDRTKMTALLVLAGLFPPTISQMWNESIRWQPIPYHYEKNNYDYTLRRPNAYCPTYTKEMDEVFSSLRVQQEVKAHRKLFEYLEKSTKMPVRKLLDVFRIYQTLNAEENMNLTLPEWTRSVYPDQIASLAGKQVEYENYNPILKRLNGGRMLAKVIKHMVDKSNGSANPTKIYLYSGHENNVINILSALNLFRVPHVPKYSAAAIIELHLIPETKKYGVKVFYARDVYSEPELQKLDDCDVLCPLNNFIQITSPHVPVNYTAECDSHVNLDS